MATIELTHDILKALAVGIERLNDSDDTDRRSSTEAEKALARAGYVIGHGYVYSAKQASKGYIRGVYVYLVSHVDWSAPVQPGDVLTLDEEGTIPLRTL